MRMHASQGQEKVEFQLRGCITGRVDLEVSVVGTWSGYGGMALSVLRSIVILASFILMRCHNQPLITYLFIKPRDTAATSAS